MTPAEIALALRAAREWITTYDPLPGSRIDAHLGLDRAITEIARLLPEEERYAFRSACRRS
jgi:hypothetical protein